MITRILLALWAMAIACKSEDQKSMAVPSSSEGASLAQSAPLTPAAPSSAIATPAVRLPAPVTTQPTSLPGSVPVLECGDKERAAAVIEVTAGVGFEQTTLFVEGVATATLGRTRSFESPILCKGRDYTYSMEFRWAGGQSPAKAVTVRAGETAKITMP